MSAIDFFTMFIFTHWCWRIPILAAYAGITCIFFRINSFTFFIRFTFKFARSKSFNFFFVYKMVNWWEKKYKLNYIDSFELAQMLKSIYHPQNSYRKLSYDGNNYPDCIEIHIEVRRVYFLRKIPDNLHERKRM